MNKDKIAEALITLRLQILNEDAAKNLGIDTYTLTGDVRYMFIEAITAVIVGEWVDFHDGDNPKWGVFRSVRLDISAWLEDPTCEGIGYNGMGAKNEVELVDWIFDEYLPKAE